MQLEYSLLERTIEGDLVPMASEFGLGITPWSPLKSGVLSGAYRRNGSASDVRRGDWAKSGLSDHAYAVIDTLVQIADETGSAPFRSSCATINGETAARNPLAPPVGKLPY